VAHAYELFVYDPLLAAAHLRHHPTCLPRSTTHFCADRCLQQIKRRKRVHKGGSRTCNPRYEIATRPIALRPTNRPPHLRDLAMCRRPPTTYPGPTLLSPRSDNVGDR